jgi:Tfp pilus assembly protein PilZ
VKILYATFESPDDFLRRLEVGIDGAAGSLAIATRARYPQGERVILEIGFPGLPNRILTRAVAVGARPPTNGVRLGWRSKRASTDSDEQLFRLVRGEEYKRDFLVAVATGRASASWIRRHRRFPLRLPARFAVDGEDLPLRGDAQTEDLSSGGASLKTSRTLPDGARVTVSLEPADGVAAIEFTGRVVWTRKSGGLFGVGIQFDRLDAGHRRRLRRLLRDVKLSGETGEPQVESTGER